MDIVAIKQNVLKMIYYAQNGCIAFCTGWEKLQIHFVHDKIAPLIAIKNIIFGHSARDERSFFNIERDHSGAKVYFY